MGEINFSFKIIWTVLLFFFLFLDVSAQNSKPHFVINNSDSIENINYSNLLKDFDFDKYRFYEKRRRIMFANADITVDLYSAKELLENYQKQISPFTIMDTIAEKEITLFLNAGKVQIITAE